MTEDENLTDEVPAGDTVEQDERLQDQLTELDQGSQLQTPLPDQQIDEPAENEGQPDPLPPDSQPVSGVPDQTAPTDDYPEAKEGTPDTAAPSE